MCYLNISKIDRPIIERNVVLLRKEKFDKIGNDKFIKVLSAHERSEMSKSYFYFVLGKMRELGLMEDNGLAFKAVISFEPKGEKMELEEKLIYVTEDKELVLMDLERDEYSCRSCSIRSMCVSYLKLIAKESGAKVSKMNPRDAWKEVIGHIRKNLVENTYYLKVPSHFLFEERKGEEKEVEISCARS
ncbi:hypothetical protein L3N51_02237 [Metallosphaera sp. J1]|nr:hypothetical protein [Metallosphaera javensis (ex Hofmann et al. 2022)]